jgi:nicotinate-nucleotide pyrophosphorylase (carboxylating)
MPATAFDPNKCSLSQLWEHLAASGLVSRLIDLARDEDLADTGDATSRVCLPPAAQGRAELVARSGGVLSGLAALPLLFARFAPNCSVRLRARDGERAAPRTTVATLEGPLAELLALERTLLNLLGRLSGIATLTARYAAAIPPRTRAKLFDTRKTTPGLRVLEKYAVRCGGGFSHRLGLHDAVLIKDNHLAGVTLDRLPAFIADAARKARDIRSVQFIEVEVDSLEQFRALLTLPARTIDIVLLDNMKPDQLREAAQLRQQQHPRLELEASGGVTLGTLPEIAATGVDRISVGALTHQAQSIDVALDVVGAGR